MNTTITLPEWSDETPSTPGLYRWRKNDEMEWVLVEDGDGVITAATFGDTLFAWSLEWGGQWQGPIVINEEGDDT